MANLNTARSVAIMYAVAVLCAGLLLLTSTLSQQPSWNRIAGHAGIALIAPLPPLITLWLGRKLSRSEAAKLTLAAGVLASVAVPAILGLFVLLSSEPLAMLFMFYTPVVQLVVGIATLVMVAARSPAARP